MCCWWWYDVRFADFGSQRIKHSALLLPATTTAKRSLMDILAHRMYIHSIQSIYPFHIHPHDKTGDMGKVWVLWKSEPAAAGTPHRIIITSQRNSSFVHFVSFGLVSRFPVCRNVCGSVRGLSTRCEQSDEWVMCVYSNSEKRDKQRKAKSIDKEECTRFGVMKLDARLGVRSRKRRNSANRNISGTKCMQIQVTKTIVLLLWWLESEKLSGHHVKSWAKSSRGSYQ